MIENNEHRIVIDRPNLNEKLFQEKYTLQKFKSENVLNGSKNYIKKYYTPNPSCMKRFLFDRVPIIKWIKEYNIRQCLLKDLISGLTIGVVQIPQGMGYSIMAGLPPINGLYVSFFLYLFTFFSAPRVIYHWVYFFRAKFYLILKLKFKK